MLARTLAVSLIALAAAAGALAQNRKPKLQWERFEGEGTVAAYRGGALLMTLKGEPWIGAVAPASKLSITGFASREVLRPGVVVRLSAEFDRKTGAALAPVSELAIVTPRPGDQAGVFPDEVIDPTERRKGPPPPTMKLRIFDAISGRKEDTLFFKRYRVELSPDATITVDLADPALLSQGDAVEKVKGKRLKGTRGRLVIEELEAVLTQPLAAKKKSPPNAAKRTPASNGDIFSIAGEEADGKKKAGEEETKKPE